MLSLRIDLLRTTSCKLKMASHCIRKKKKGVNGFLSIKIHMSKASHMVKWVFLRELLLRLGFHSIWVNKVMCCVECARYNRKVNGMFSEEIKRGRDLRQGIRYHRTCLSFVRNGSRLYILQHEKKVEGI